MPVDGDTTPQDLSLTPEENENEVTTRLYVQFRQGDLHQGA